MSPTESSRESAAPSPTEHGLDAERKEWILRGVAAVVIVLLFWLAYQDSSGATLLFLAPLIAGAFVAALRMPAASGAVDSVENWLKGGSAKAASQQGKFARFFKRPFFGGGLAIWRWTAPIRDAHLRAGVRVTAFIFLSGIAISLLVMAAYIIVAIVVLILVIAIAGWILSLSGNSSGRAVRVTRYTSDWLGRPKEEHFDATGNKVGESKPDTDWLGRPKMVHTDAEGNEIGESKPDTDWLGNPKTVHTDAEGHKVGESRPDTDWLGGPKTVHTDAEGHIVGESREEKDVFGERKTVRYKE